MALVLIFAGLSFRVTAVPFHFYAPDVYQGTIHANAALLSVLPKAAGLLVLVRLVLLAMPGMAPTPGGSPWRWRSLTMTVGNVLALWQDNLRRLLAYSSIANAGYMLIGLAVGLATPARPPGHWDGIAAMLFYLCVYAAATLGTSPRLVYLGRDGSRSRPSTNWPAWAGPGPPWPRPWPCACSAWPACRRWPGCGASC